MYWVGFGLEFAIWLLGLMVLYDKKKFGGVMLNFGVIAILPFIVFAIEIFVAGVPIYEGGPIILSEDFWKFRQGIIHSFIVMVLLNLAVAQIIVAREAKRKVPAEETKQ